LEHVCRRCLRRPWRPMRGDVPSYGALHYRNEPIAKEPAATGLPGLPDNGSIGSLDPIRRVGSMAFLEHHLREGLHLARAKIRIVVSLNLRGKARMGAPDR